MCHKRKSFAIQGTLIRSWSRVIADNHEWRRVMLKTKVLVMD